MPPRSNAARLRRPGDGPVRGWFWLALALAVTVRAQIGLSRQQAEEALATLWAERRETLQAERAAEMQARQIPWQELSLRWEERVFGEEPAGGRSLWISLHGGGGTTAEVNDAQWRNQIGLYQPAEGIYIAPRAPTNTWDLWHQSHIDPLFDRLIEDYVVLRGVNPDRVFVLGYSAGGDGVWQLAPRMADRWAAAAMMAGHPNDAALLPLRNLPFALFVGGEDAAYDRNRVVGARAVQLDALRAADPAGYEHFARIYPGLPHWMDRRDAEALPWMAAHTRNPWPRRVVWVQDDVTHTRFYWLAVPATGARPGARIIAEARDQTLLVDADPDMTLTLRLSDALVDLDQPLRVRVAGREVFSGRVARSAEALRGSLAERADPRSAAAALLRVGPGGAEGPAGAAP